MKRNKRAIGCVCLVSFLICFLAVFLSTSMGLAFSPRPHVQVGLLVIQDDVEVNDSENNTNEISISNSNRQKQRIYLVGAICGSIVGVLVTLFGYFRLNEATRGFYSGRLQAITLLTIGILLGLAIWFAQKFAF